ncbi:MAG: stage V sporulation protein AB [Clostridiales bacterium]|nr:stage V sporulation protein AB [Clostridiales bacterium]
MTVFKYILSALIGFCSGAIISGAVFAFITMIGVVPRFAQKTRTQKYVKWYENTIALGGISGTLMGFFNPAILIGTVGAVVFSLCVGVFYGCLAMSLAEVLNVIPILSRRGRVRRGMFFFILAIAAGKMAGSLLYFINGGFHTP